VWHRKGVFVQLSVKSSVVLILILGWCILLRLYYNKNSYLCSQLIVSLLYEYIDHTTCFGYTAIFRCVTYKNAKNCYYNLTDPLI
jgi:hypothetical protein